MTISNKTSKENSGSEAGANGRKGGAKASSSLTRTLYKWWKYGTIIGVVLTIVLVGLVVLGEVAEETGKGSNMEMLYKGSKHFS